MRSASLGWWMVKSETKGKGVAEYDSTPVATYDSGITYDSAPLPQPFKRMPKIKVKLNLDAKSDTDLLAFAQAHEAAHLLPRSAGLQPVVSPICNRQRFGWPVTVELFTPCGLQIHDTADCQSARAHLDPAPDCKQAGARRLRRFIIRKSAVQCFRPFPSDTEAA